MKKTCKLQENAYFCKSIHYCHNMKIGIIIAMDKEFVQLRTMLSHATTSTVGGKEFTVGEVGNKEIIMQKCGIGKVNAAIGTVEMINAFHPDIVISTGCAGGAGDDMEVGDVVVGNEYVYHDVYCGSEVSYGQFVGLPATFSADEQLLKKATTLDCSTKIHSGLMVCGDWFVDSREKMREILGHFPDAKAVDMESCAIAQTCHLYGVPFISFRIVSDVPLSDHKASQYFDFWNRLAEGSFNVTKTFIESL